MFVPTGNYGHGVASLTDALLFLNDHANWSFGPTYGISIHAVACKYNSKGDRRFTEQLIVTLTLQSSVFDRYHANSSRSSSLSYGNKCKLIVVINKPTIVGFAWCSSRQTRTNVPSSLLDHIYYSLYWTIVHGVNASMALSTGYPLRKTPCSRPTIMLWRSELEVIDALQCLLDMAICLTETLLKWLYRNYKGLIFRPASFTWSSNLYNWLLFHSSFQCLLLLLPQRNK